MAGTITHEWNGTILTITSDSGTSSADLKGSIGDIGPRGPQGPAGVIIESDGSINMNGYATEEYVNTKIDGVLAGDIDLSNYYTKAEVDKKIDDIEVGGGSDADLSNYYTKSEVDAKHYATETFVTTKIAEAQLSGGEGGDIDLSGYLLKDGSTPMTGRLIIQSPDGLWLDDSGSDANLYMNFDRSHQCAAIYSDGDIAFTTFDKRIIGVATPVEGTDVANKSYVDTAISNALAALDGDEVTY
jgi:hypothetical protein